MSNVINFPGSSEANRDERVAAVREGLAEFGFSEQAIEGAIGVIKPLFDESRHVVDRGIQANFTTSVNEDELRKIEAELTEAFQSYGDAVADFIQKLIVEIAFLEARARDN